LSLALKHSTQKHAAWLGGGDDDKLISLAPAYSPYWFPSPPLVLHGISQRKVTCLWDQLYKQI
jgi:hypothetical protein